MMIILNVATWVQTQFFWMESIEFDDNRNEMGWNAWDLTMWQLVQNVPTLIFLVFFYIFMVDIENHFITNPSSEATLNTLYISDYTIQLITWWKNYLVLQDNTLAIVYLFLYNLYTIYLNPIQWVTWTIQGVTYLYN